MRRPIRHGRELSRLSLFLPACFLFFSGPVVCAPPQAVDTSAEETPLVQGPQLYRAFCAACHGAKGKGDGPAAEALKAATPDLTVLARRNKGPFPSRMVEDAITNTKAPPAHGTAEMPVWGPAFRQVVPRGEESPRKLNALKQSGITSPELAKLRLANLVNYIESLQVK
jgi:mono/diheme cytochrome c family protein